MGNAAIKTRLAHTLLRTECYVDGSWVGAPQELDVVNPANDESIAAIPQVSASVVEAAIAAAKRALPSWRSLLPRQRGDLLLAWREQMLANREALAALVTLEQGKPISEASAEIDYGAEFVRWYAEEASRIYGEVIPSHLADCQMVVTREPLGVVALVTPWNFPSAMLTRKASAALASGCTIVSTPSNETPFSALALALLADRIGFPAGVFNVITGDPELVVGKFCRDPDIRGLSFTGSTRIGRLLAEKCASTVKRVSLELGGHAPVLVFSDAEVEGAAAATVRAKFQSTGQDCLAANRIFVHREIYEAFLKSFLSHTHRLRTGPGFDEGVDLGPLINPAALAKIQQHTDDAVRLGARLLAGGKVCKPRSLFYEPTILADVTPAMAIMHEETFGPVAAIVPFDQEADVVAAANDTEYGLVAYVFTRDVSRAHRVARALEYGMVAVNTTKLTGAPIPFGGVKQSGLGREGSRHGIEEFTELKYVCLQI